MTEPVTNGADRADERDSEYGLAPELVASVMRALEVGDRDAVLALLRDLHVADIADLVEQIDSDSRRKLIELVWADIDQEFLVEVEEGVRDEILQYLPAAKLADVVKDLESDDAVYLLEDLDEAQRREVLAALEPGDRAAVSMALEYPEYTAGRLMQSEFVKAPPYWTVGQMIDYLRAADELPEPFYDIVIVDPAAKPLGKVALGTLIGARRPVTLESLMSRDFRTIHVEDPQEDVAYAFRHYHLVSAPVVDNAGRVVGVITIDDAMEVLDEEAGEDILRLGGVGDEEISDDVWEITRRRCTWLAVNLLTAILASAVVGLFEETIDQVVALAVLMPIVASMGGIAGTQSLTVAVRALATRDLTATNAGRVFMREVTAGVINGLIFAVVMGSVAWAWFGDPAIGGLIGAAMIINLFAAAVSGTVIPLALERAGVDPALASGTFVTTVTDVVGFFAFLGLGTLVLL